MSKPYASNAAVKATQGRARRAHGYEVTWDGKALIVYDDEEAANRMATEFGTYAKHSPAKFDGSYWKVFSLVGLPSD